MESTYITVGKLAFELRTSKEQIILWAESYDINNERMEGDYIPPCIEDYIRRKHLKLTHPKVDELVTSINPDDHNYFRWIGWTYHLLKKRGE